MSCIDPAAVLRVGALALGVVACSSGKSSLHDSDAGESGDAVLDELTATRPKEGNLVAWCSRGAAPSTRLGANFTSEQAPPVLRERTFTKNCVVVHTKRDREPSTAFYDAGTMSVVHPAGTMTIEEAPLGTYLTNPAPDALWLPGDRAAFSFTGNVVPGFSTELAFPADFDLLDPRDGNGARRTDDLPIAWTSSGAPNDVFVEIKQDIASSGGMDDNTFALCRGRAGETQMTIPKEVMSRFSVQDLANNIPAAQLVFIPHPRYLLSAGEFKVLVDVGGAVLQFAMPLQ